MNRLLRLAVAIPALALLVACGEAEQKGFDLTDAGIKTLDRKIAQVRVSPQVDGSTNLVEVTIHEDPTFGGSGEWNGIATNSHRLLSTLFARPDVSRVRISYVSPANKGIDWAQVSMTRSDLPADWKALTYLQFFSRTKPLPGTLETGVWLCEFYQKYESSRPPSGVAARCKD